MGVFDNVGDVPGQLSSQALQITLTFEPGVPAAGQATLTWNIPVPDSSSGKAAYAGMLIVVAPQPVTGHNIPKDGLTFVADPTFDPDKFSGDKINGANVIAYIYEADVIAKGGTPTTSVVINDYDKSKNYYICGYSMDAQRRYDHNGSRAYSDRLGRPNQPGTPASQTILLGFNPNNLTAGVLPTAGTGLIAGATYQFQLIYDSGYPHGKGMTKSFFISFDGSVAGTYGDLVKEINKQLAIQSSSVGCYSSPVVPGQGIYYWDGHGQLWQWDGTGLIAVPNVIIQDTDPTLIDVGTYWYQPITNTLFQWDGLTWVVIPTIDSPYDPTNPPPGSWWWDGTNAYTRCGNAWCEVPVGETYVSTTDPSCPATPVNCAFWFNPTTQALETYNGVQWVPAYAVTWPVAPNAITTGSYWYDLTNSVLYVRNAGPGWDVQPFISSTTDPALVPVNAVVAGTLWYDPSTEALWLRNPANTAWIAQLVLVWPTDPTNIASCSLWFDDSSSSPGILKEWDIVHSQWVPVTPYFSQATDPFGTPTTPTGAVWFNPTTGVLSVWTGNTWEAVAFINFPVDPTLPANGTAWHNTSTGVWSVWNTPNPGWNVITPTISNTAPNLLAVGQLWFDTTIPNHLWRWDGTMWVEVPFTTTKPVLKKGQNWYDMTTGRLYQWDGTQWVWIKPAVYCQFDAHGNLIFLTTGTGSNYVIMIPIPNGIPYMASSLVVYGTGAADYVNDVGTQNAYYPYGAPGGRSLFDIPIADGFYYDGLYSGLDYFGDFSGNLGNGVGPVDAWISFNGGGLERGIPYRVLPINPGAFLWSNLQPSANVLIPSGGQDGVSGTPSYDELGVGTDGSPDERRNIMKIIRTELGYPTVTVELTDDQLSRAVSDALETFRQRSSMSVKRACFFLDIQPYNQHYVLANKAVDYNKIVTVMAGYRFTSAFLSQAMGSGVYGQVVMQHLYNMGTFDLLSYHIVSAYVEQLEIMFATRLTYVWDESKRRISFHQSFTRPERILLDVTLEKTEQEIFLDRYAKRWIQQFAQAQAMDMLAQIRGKYASLPGASGAVTLNAQDLRTQAKEIRDMLYTELDELIVQDVESYGAYGSIVMG
jgi:hypothetical protein